jgi:gamma-glutamyltranspeptidase / glutathione hydrolase
MNRRIWFATLLACWSVTFCGAVWPQEQEQSGPRLIGAAATVHPLATQAALETLSEGGNAVDAAVSAALMLNVVNGYNSGIGGGCFVLIRRGDGTLAAIDGRETAPAAATETMYLVDGQADPELSRTGPLASGVPGALAAYELAVRQHGRQPLSSALRRAARVAELGFIVDAGYAGALRRTADDLRKFDGSRQHFFDGEGQLPAAGDIFRQPDLAATLSRIADEGADWFYRGPFAERCAAWMKQHGGLLTAEDFAEYRPRIREPIVSSYRGHTIVGFPPPSSGGIHVAQILNILESFDLAALAEADRMHVLAEAMKLAFADRAYWLGDADFANVPRGLVDKEYARRLAGRIALEKASDVPAHAVPPGAETEFFGRKHTTHLTAMDGEGNWVAITATVNTTFGSKVVIPGTGVVMNNEMDDFSAQPGVPNAFGLLGAEANKIAPGKRPLSSMSPTIVLRDDRPVFTCGAAGGPTIITQAVLAIVREIDLGLSPQANLSQPRIHHQWKPDALAVERALDPELRAELERRGHSLRERSQMGVSQAIGYGASGAIEPAFDPRVPGAAGVLYQPSADRR